MLAGLVPWLLTRWQIRPAFFGFEPIRPIGIVLILIGVAGLIDSFARFVLDGLGTPAPIAPTQKLVVTGLYRYVRNPMYVSVLTVILGQALLFGDLRLILLGALVWLAAHVFLVGYEERRLEREFGSRYRIYRTNTNGPKSRPVPTPG